MLRVLDKPAVLLGLVLAVLLGVYLGSAAQALIARLLGDPMPIRAGWLKPSLKRQLGIFSAIAVLIVGWGWAEPVPMNDRWRARRFHVATAILVRPLVYALLCLATLGGLRTLTSEGGVDAGGRSISIATGGGSGFAAELLLTM